MKLILHVDDMPDQRDLVKAILEPEGYHVVDTDGGEEAVRELSSGEFAAIVLDLRMPKGRGEMVIQWIAQHRPTLKRRVVVTSGDPPSAEMEEMARRHEITWLPKPYKVEQLRQVVQRITAAGMASD